jgi:RimJ/RimL family protein N-acetyltransferase
MIPIPTLTTDRLILRPFRDDDLDAHAKICPDPGVMRYLPLHRMLTCSA